MKAKFETRKFKTLALFEVLLLVALIGLLALFAPPQVKATELTPPVPLSQNVGTGNVAPSVNAYRQSSFIVSGYAGILITNAGGVGATIVTNDYGVTNLTAYIRQSPNTVLPPGTLYTNALINPYWWLVDGQAAIYQSKTGARLWQDIDLPFNAGTLAGNSNVVFYVQESGEKTTTTNQNTFVLLHSVDGRIFDTNDTWSVTGPRITGTNVNGTNVPVPISFLNGYRKARLFQLNAGTNGTAGSNYIHDIGIAGVAAN